MVLTPGKETSERKGTIVTGFILVCLGIVSVAITAIFSDPARLTTILAIMMPVVAAGLTILQSSYNIARGIAKTTNGNQSEPPILPPG